MMRSDTDNVDIITVKGVDYSCIIYYVCKYDTIHLLENFVLDDCGFIQNSFLPYQY